MAELGLLGCELRNKHSNKGKHAVTFSKYLPRGVDNSVAAARSDSEFCLPPMPSLDHHLHLQNQVTFTSWGWQKQAASL